MQGKNIVVSLSLDEATFGIQNGVYRRLKATKGRYKNAHGLTKSSWDIDINGALAEQAFCKAAGIYFSPNNNAFSGADIVGTNVQVRTTSYKNGRLIVREGDDLDCVYVLAIIAFPEVTLVGWISGKDAAKKKYLDDAGKKRKPAWFVPQEDLNPFPLPP